MYKFLNHVPAVHRLPLKLLIHLWHSEMKIYKTEILWMIKMCVEDWSFASSVGISDIFRTMFPGQISSSFSLSRTMGTLYLMD